MASQEGQGFGNTNTSIGFKTPKDAIFEESTAKAFRAAHRRKWTGLAAIVLVLAIAIGALVFNHASSEREKDVVRDYLKIDAEYLSQSESFQEKVKAAGAAAADLTPDFSAVADKFAAFASAHTDIPLGWQAAFRATTIYVNAKKLDAAEKLLEPIENKTLKYALIQIRVRRALAGIYAEKKEFDKAIAELEFIEKIPDNPMLDETRLFKAQVLYLAGKKEDAAKILKELAQNGLLAFDPAGKNVASEASQWLGYWGL